TIVSLLRPRPPHPTLFPYTTLFRSLREAAVLVPLVMREGRPAVVLTKRPLTLRNHAGQISFPGGARDPEDPTPLHTALRESEERSEEHTSELQSRGHLVCRLLLDKN